MVQLPLLQLVLLFAAAGAAAGIAAAADPSRSTLYDTTVQMIRSCVYSSKGVLSLVEVQSRFGDKPLGFLCKKQ